MSFLRYLRSRRQPCFKKAHYRRNGWDVKPRHGKDPNALIVEDKWWHDSSKSVYLSRAEGWVSVASGSEAEPTPPWSDMSSMVIGVGFPGAP